MSRWRRRMVGSWLTICLPHSTGSTATSTRMAASADPEVEISALEKEFEGPSPEPGLSRTINDGGSSGSTGQATSAYPVAAVNRSVHNDATGTSRSRNDAMQRVAWIERCLAELRSGKRAARWPALDSRWPLRHGPSAASMKRIAPSLSRGSLKLPHLGDCTQLGHP